MNAQIQQNLQKQGYAHPAAVLPLKPPKGTPMSQTYELTSESVSPGHPDKVADRISDEIVDAGLRHHPRARIAAETLVTRSRCVIAGELRDTGLTAPDLERIARDTIRALGYLDGDFTPDVPIDVLIHEQSAEIAAGVDGAAGREEGAGDQGIMFGFACDETPEQMPAPLACAHRILRKLEAHRKSTPGLGPDAKSQVTVEYRDGHPVRASTVVVSQMHAPEVTLQELTERIRPLVQEALPPGWFDARTRLLVNPTGSFILGGPSADTGLTGRKIIVDTYGGAAPHGGGAFSGKDPTKVDRSAAYAARWLAKNVVQAGLAHRCLIQLAYAIGVAEPVALYVDLQGTGRIPDPLLAQNLLQEVDLTPRGIREALQLERPIYARTAALGHFGRAPDADGGFSWERTDLAPRLARLL